MRKWLLVYFIAVPTIFFTVIACLVVGPFGLAVPAWVIWLLRRQAARENGARNPVVYDFAEFHGPRTPDLYAPAVDRRSQGAGTDAL